MDESEIKQRIKEFTWYTPVDFGNNITAKGNFKVTTSIDSIHFGLGKWRYIIERNLPDLQGKRVMDIGCNAGIFCIQMSRMGAREVVGIDSDKTWTNWLEQAQFVKEALEWRCNTRYNIAYIDSDMERIPDLNLGHFDVVTALCCIYYLEEEKIYSLFNYLREHVDHLVIQCNTRKADQSPDVHRRAKPKFIANALKKAGYPFIKFDKPLLYERPVVVGFINPLNKKPNMSKIDKLRYFVRNKI